MLFSILFRAAVVGSILLLAGCSSTELVTRWSDPGYHGAPMRKILVIGLLKDELHRRNLEQALVQRLQEAGVDPVTGYRLIPDPAVADDREKLKGLVAAAGVDGVLIARLKGVDREETYVPPRTEVVPSMGLGYGYYGYYHMSFQAVYQPGYTRTDTIVRLESQLFSAGDGKLLWAGETRSFNPDSASTVARELAELVVKDIRRSGLIR